MNNVFDILPIFQKKLKIFHVLLNRPPKSDDAYFTDENGEVKPFLDVSSLVSKDINITINKKLVYKIILYDPILLDKPNQDVQFPAEIWSMEEDYTVKEYVIINLNKEIITYVINGDILPLGKYIKELIVEILKNDSKIGQTER